MQYQSTRDSRHTASAAQAILQGIAPDGGLYMLPDPGALAFPMEKLGRMSAMEISETVLGLLLPDFTPAELHAIVAAAYTHKFETEDLVPLTPVGGRYILELFRGPTSAFKDVALSVLPHLISTAKAKLRVKEDILILTATSGDTGKAALEGFHDVPGTRIVVFYPYGGVSRIQQAQMVTQVGGNVRVCAIEGNFDDAQSGVKAIFTSARAANALSGKAMLSSANSINIGRLAPQVMYYFKAYGDLLRAGEIRLGDPVDFVVPTGNFGNILAGYLAKKLGLPAGKFLCASNSNKVLTDFLITGTYDRNRPFHKTISPSMDILISSNLERLVYLACDGDCHQVAGYMAQLASSGRYTLSDRARNAIQTDFLAGCADDRQTKAAIRRVYERYGYLMDTHTAVAWDVADQVPLSNKTVILSTASPYKFCGAVLEALGEALPEDDFAQMEQLRLRTGMPVPANLAGLRQLPVLHRDVISRDKMEDYVLGLSQRKKEGEP